MKAFLALDHCREDRIRTCDPYVPNVVRYRAALLPDGSANLMIRRRAGKIVKTGREDRPFVEVGKIDYCLP